jgi:hypothetical protein
LPLHPLSASLGNRRPSQKTSLGLQMSFKLPRLLPSALAPSGWEDGQWLGPPCLSPTPSRLP